VGESPETLLERGCKAHSSPSEDTPARRVTPIAAQTGLATSEFAISMANSRSDGTNIVENGQGGVFQLPVT